MPYTLKGFFGSVITVPAAAFPSVGAVPCESWRPDAKVIAYFAAIGRFISIVSVDAPSEVSLKTIIPVILPFCPGSSPSVAGVRWNPFSSDQLA